MSFLPPINQNQKKKDFFNFDDTYRDKLNALSDDSEHENFNDFYENKKVQDSQQINFEQNKQKQTYNQSEKERSNKLVVKPLDMNFKIDDNLEEMPQIKEKEDDQICINPQSHRQFNQSSLLAPFQEDENKKQREDNPYDFPEVLELMTMFPEKDPYEIFKYYKLNGFSSSDTINFMLDQKQKFQENKVKKVKTKMNEEENQTRYQPKTQNYDRNDSGDLLEDLIGMNELNLDAGFQNQQNFDNRNMNNLSEQTQENRIMNQLYIQQQIEQQEAILSDRQIAEMLELQEIQEYENLQQLEHQHKINTRGVSPPTTKRNQAPPQKQKKDMFDKFKDKVLNIFK